MPTGWRPGAPHYVGVGTARSGTSWWDRLICAHPRVIRLPGTPKDVHFFDDRWDRGLDDRDVERYHAWFARPAGSISGEWTPDYMLQAWTPALLHRAAPEARLLVLLRDPVERFRSAQTLAEHRVTIGATARAAANATFHRGLYADQLLRLWAAFPPEQVLVLQYEQCVADPRGQLLRTYAFIGLDASLPEDVDLSQRVGATGGPRVSLSTWQEAMLVRRYGPENERLATLVPDLDLALWRMPS